MLIDNIRFDPILGMEKKCTRCGQWWPADGEFYPYADLVTKRLGAWCKCCTLEYKARGKNPKPIFNTWEYKTGIFLGVQKNSLTTQ